MYRLLGHHCHAQDTNTSAASDVIQRNISWSGIIRGFKRLKAITSGEETGNTNTHRMGR